MRISACVITKDEEMNIPACLASVKQVVSEVIVVDTGSTDNTVMEALKHGAKIYHFQWQNDFSKARNYAISKAKGDWIIFLDADEYYTKESVSMIPKVIAEAEKGGYDVIYSILINYDNELKKNYGTAPVLRIFRNKKGIKYRGAIHELLEIEGRELKKLDATKHLKIIHTGYTRKIVDQKNKSSRNLTLLLKELQSNPKSSNLCFYIAEAYIIANDFDAAIDYAFRVFKYRNGTLLGLYQKNYLNILFSMMARGYPLDDIKHAARQAIAEYPDFPDYHFYLGDIYRQEGRLNDAIYEYQMGLQNIDKGINYQSRAPFNMNKVLMILGDLYYKLGQFAKTTKYLIEVLKADIYEFSTLNKLIKLFSRHERDEDIYLFLKKLYDYENPKDLLLLLKASLKANNGRLAEYYYKLLYDNQYVDLGSESAHIKFLNRNYADAALEYLKLYLTNNKTGHAFKCIVSSVLIGDDQRLNEIYEKSQPSWKRIIDKELKREVEIMPDDKNDILNYFMEYVKIDEIDRLLSRMDWVLEARLLYEVAELLYFYEKYSVAAELFQKFMAGQSYIPVHKQADIYSKIGECLCYCNRYIEALQFYSQSRRYNPFDYRAYERPMIICELIADQEQLKEITQKGLYIFPESYFMASKLTKNEG